MSKRLHEKLSSVVQSTLTTKRHLTSPEEVGNQTKKAGQSTSVNTVSTNMADKSNAKKSNEGWEKAMDEMRKMNEKILTVNNELKEEVVAARNELHEMKKSFDWLAAKYDDHERELDKLKKENQLLKNELSSFNRHLDDIDQYGRRQNVLFDKIEERSGENTHETITEICKSIGIDIDKKDLQATHRLGKPRIGEKSPRPIIARFTNVNTARTVIQTVKQQKKRSSDHVNQNGRHANNDKLTANIWVREHLTDYRSKLLHECLKLKKENKIYACWVFSYNIYVKIRQQDTSGKKITTLEELKSLLN